MTSPLRLYPRGDRPVRADELLDAPEYAPVGAAAAWRTARTIWRTHRVTLLIGVALSLVSRLSGLVLPASTRYFIDDVLATGERTALVPLVSIVLAATVVQAGTGILLARLLGGVAQRAVAALRVQLAERVFALPVSRVDSMPSGALTARIMTDPEGIRNLLGTGFVQLLGGIITATAALGMLLVLHWRMTLVTIVMLGGMGIAMAVAFARLRPMARQRNIEFGRVSARLTEAIGGIRILKAYVAEGREATIFARGADRLLTLVMRTLTGWAVAGALTAVVVGGIGVTLILLGGRAVIAGEMTLGELATYAVFTALVAAPLVQVAQIATQLAEALAGLDRANELLREPVEDQGSGRTVPRLRGEIRLEGVSFAYEPTVPVLRNVSITCPAGTTTAIVGASGSGKSTLLGLLAAFHRPASGVVWVDDLDLAELELAGYRRQVGLVLQETFLFDDTILENIRLARPDATLSEVERVAALAHCDEFVRRFPNGWSTVVGERGIRLSGGQKQRVAIARALLVDPAILLLDEATSSLDSESEAHIQAGLAALRRGRTTVVIAHRLSTILGADQIVVLDGGEVVESGRHEALVQRAGRYAELYRAQQRLGTDAFVNQGEELRREL